MKLNSGRRQLIQTGIANVAGMATVGVSKIGVINAQAESIPKRSYLKDKFNRDRNYNCNYRYSSKPNFQ